MSSKREPAIGSLDTGQRIPYFDRYSSIITWLSNSKGVRCKPRLHVLGQTSSCMATLSRGSVAIVIAVVFVVVVVVRTCPRIILLAMITTRKSIHAFFFISVLSMLLRFVALRAEGDPLLISHLMLCNKPYFLKEVDTTT